MISYKFSSKYDNIREVYFDAILVPIAVPRIWMSFILLNWKELLFRISSISSVIKFLLNILCNVTRYISMQIEMVCFPDSWEILLDRFVMSNVTMSVLGSVFCSMEFKKGNIMSNVGFYHIIFVVKYPLVCQFCWGWGMMGLLLWV